jgi:hypothetical protein
MVDTKSKPRTSTRAAGANHKKQLRFALITAYARSRAVLVGSRHRSPARSGGGVLW